MFKKLILSGLVCLVICPALTTVTEGADSSLLGWWKLDGGEGAIAIDSSGNDNHGTINNPNGGLGLDGSVWDVDPNRGTVMSFNGDNADGAYVRTDMTTPMTLFNGFTWAFWAKQDAAQGHNDDVIVGNRWGGSTWIKFTPSFFEFGGSAPDTAINYDNFPADIWVHHAVVKDGTQYTYYRDGVISGESTILTTSGPLPFLMGGDTDGERWRGWLSHVRIYDRALSQTEIQIVMRGKPELSFEPDPPSGASEIPRDQVILSWSPGTFADTHDVYVGTVPDDVQNASREDPRGVLIAAAHDAESYEFDRLLFGQTYYWRIDEVNAPPESTIYKGDVWNFTTEFYAPPIPGDRLNASASGYTAGQEPQNTINNSGLDSNGLHSNSAAAMWLSDSTEPGSAWIRYDFDRPYKIHEMQVWNYNGQLFLPGFGFKDVLVEYSDNGTDWTPLDQVTEFARAPGTNDYAAETIVNFNEMVFQFVRITALSNWGSALFKQYGLSEVRFLQIPVYARRPGPEDGATDVRIDVTLDWTAGRQTAEHRLYLDTDRQAVIDGTLAATVLSQAANGPLALDLGTAYFWRVDEVNHAESPSIWPGETWSFTTQQYLVVDDFEAYNDIPIEEEGSNLVYDTWSDGFSDPANGSMIGYTAGSSLETGALVHGGRFSAPVFYDHTEASYSEITANTNDLAIGQDWTKGSAEALVIWFYGDPNNAAVQMYVKVNQVKQTYDGDLTQQDWQTCSVDLASLGIDLSNVTTLTIGFEKTGATGETGMVFIDDIWLYSPTSTE